MGRKTARSSWTRSLAMRLYLTDAGSVVVQHYVETYPTVEI
ncbi:hypothetical protein [Streptomyces sp. NPDC093589]